MCACVRAGVSACACVRVCVHACVRVSGLCVAVLGLVLERETETHGEKQKPLIIPPMASLPDK